MLNVLTSEMIEAVTVGMCCYTRSGRPGSSAGRPGTASRPPALKPGAGGKRCSTFCGLCDIFCMIAFLPFISIAKKCLCNGISSIHLLGYCLCQIAKYTSKHFSTHSSTIIHFLTMQHYASVVYTVVACPSICLSVTSPYCTKISKHMITQTTWHNITQT